MTYYQDNHVTIYNKDCRDMSELSDSSVQCVVTSPPYWGLRKYSGEQDLIWGGEKVCLHEYGNRLSITKGGKGQQKGLKGNTHIAETWDESQTIQQGSFCSLCGAWKGAYGLEPTPELYVQHTIEILREIRRVLRKDGVVFLNIGDSYFGGGNNKGGKSLDGTKQGTNIGATNLQDISDIRGKHPILKPKDLCLIPFRVAIAAQADGWWVRSVIIWNKPNPMPESVKDRPTESHEYILMLTKSARYYWDQEAVREPVAPSTIGRGPVDFGGAKGRDYQPDKTDPNFRNGSEQWGRTYDYAQSSASGRNLRSVWSFPTTPFPEAHFAVFPEKLPELCIKAATPEVGCCAECGAPWERVIEKVKIPVGATKTRYDLKDNAGRLALHRQGVREEGHEDYIPPKTLGWQPTCKCNADKVPSIVLDPFAGAGTTLWVAKRLNRQAIGYDLAAEYCKFGLDRNRQQVMV